MRRASKFGAVWIHSLCDRRVTAQAVRLLMTALRSSVAPDAPPVRAAATTAGRAMRSHPPWLVVVPASPVCTMARAAEGLRVVTRRARCLARIGVARMARREVELVIATLSGSPDGSSCRSAADDIQRNSVDRLLRRPVCACEVRRVNADARRISRVERTSAPPGRTAGANVGIGPRSCTPTAPPGDASRELRDHLSRPVVRGDT